MKRLRNLMICLLIPVILCAAAGCRKQEAMPDSLAGNVYVYQPGDLLTRFEIKLKRDGSFTYSETPHSSYMGVGLWSLADGILELADDDLVTGEALKNRFRVEGDTLVFVAEGSTNFHVKLADGTVFRAQK